LFYPGYYSNDSIQQLGQAVSTIPIGDWHPPVMVMMWKLLIGLTGSPASMLLFQLLMFWVANSILGIIIFRLTANKLLSFLPIFAGMLPITIGISGVIWKDVQMSYALVLATVLILLYVTSKNLNNKKLFKWAVLGSALVLILYAGLLRYNALVAIVPLLYLLVDAAGLFNQWKVKILVSICIVLTATGLGSIMNRILDIKQDHPTSSVMLDDIVNVRQPSEINKNTGVLYETLLDIQKTCKNKKLVINSYWKCANDTNRETISQAYFEELRGYWLQTLASSPLSYMLYRFEAFAIFIFAPNQYLFSYDKPIAPNEFGQSVRYEKASNFLHVYVKEFGYRHFSYLFQAWFWISAAIATFYISLKKLKVYRREVIVLSLSSLLYIFSYMPVVVAADYRYIFWSVFATLIAALLILLETRALRPSIKK